VSAAADSVANCSSHSACTAAVVVDMLQGGTVGNFQVHIPVVVDILQGCTVGNFQVPLPVVVDILQGCTVVASQVAHTASHHHDILGCQVG
jgi:hypothetical protein